MKLFIYLLLIFVLIGGTYLLFIDHTPPPSATSVTWSDQAQIHLTTLLADQLQASQSNDWSTFDADLTKAEAHLANAPADVYTTTFRSALSVYRSQQKMRAQTQLAL